MFINSLFVNQKLKTVYNPPGNYKQDPKVHPKSSKNVQTNPAGTTAAEISLFKKLNPPVRLLQVSETTGTETHPTPTPPLQTCTVALVSGTGLAGAAEATEKMATRVMVSQPLGPRDKNILK